MMTRQLQMLHQADLRTDRNLAHWNRDEGCPVLEGYYTDTRNAGFAVSRMLLCLIHPESRHYDSERLADAVAETLRYLQKNRNADGCFDLASCNFDSAPDTAFTVNELTDACELLAASESRWRETLLPPLREIIERACEGICAGGFHTPNHRWAIAACLKQAALLTGREDFSRTADRYLREGLDINEDGEFAERSTGVYNAVNDEQMIRLYRATGNRLYLDAARRNLEMMLYYLEPDGSLFTMNSTRQDQGKRVFPVSYYKLYLLTGFLEGDTAFAAWSRVIWDACMAAGEVPEGLNWLMKIPELEAFGDQVPPEPEKLESFGKVWPASGIGRWKTGRMTVTAMAKHPCFLSVQSGSAGVQVSLYGNVCAQRNFEADAVEQTEHGFRLAACADSWYYLPFAEEDPERTTDWWAMNNPETREKQVKASLRTEISGEVAPGRLTLHLKSEGVAKVPLRLELAFTPGLLAGDQFLMKAEPGGSMTVRNGTVAMRTEAGDEIRVSPCFAEHQVLRRMGGAWPESAERFTVYLTCVTPADRTITFLCGPDESGAL